MVGELDDVFVSKVTMSRSEGRLIVRATVSNGAKQRKTLLYRFQWLGKKQEPVWTDEPWKPLSLGGKQNLTVSGTAPTLLADDVRLETYEDGAN